MTDKIINQIKKIGGRMTDNRLAIIDIFAKAKKPYSVVELIALLKNKNLLPNKTTIYREISFLLNNDLLREIMFDDRVSRYELKLDHHHHLFCKKCKKVIKLKCDGCLENRAISEAKKNKFKIVDSSIEFFGLCANCQN